MKICVYGAGVIGGILASALARADHSVSVIARGAHLAAIQRSGLTIVTPEDRVNTRLPASLNPADFGVQDLVIVATKTSAFRDVVKGVGSLIGPDTLVAFAVNGIFWFYGDGFSPPGAAIDMQRLDPDGALHRVVGSERALGMVCWGGGEIHEPGVVHATRAGGRFVAGAGTPGSIARARTLIEALRVRDIDIEATGDIRRHMWLKFFGIAGNFATCALTGGTIAQVHGEGAVQDVALALASEAHAVARAHGFLDLGFDAGKLRANPSTSPHKPSMLQDLERGREIELESTYLVLQDLAQQAGVATPTLDVVAPLLTLRARLAGCLR